MKQTEARAQFFLAARHMLPLTIAVLPIALVFGAVAVTKGLSPLEVTLMSAIVFAGGSQFVAMDIWSHPASAVSLGLAALLVNIRHVLMGTSILPRMSGFCRTQRVASLLLLADEVWAMAEVRAREEKLTPAWFAGLALPFYLTWVIGGLAGATLGRLIGDPALIGLDFAFTAVFIVLLTAFWNGRSTGLVLLASAMAALATHRLLPGVWYIAAGAAGGILAALALEARTGAAR